MFCSAFRDTGTAIVQTYTFDFFNYAGIHRSVLLYTTPVVYINDVYVTTDVLNGTVGRIHFKVSASNSSDDDPVTAYIQVKDREGKIVANKSTDTNLSGTIEIEDANLWWPYLMHDNPGYLYTFEVSGVVICVFPY